MASGEIATAHPRVLAWALMGVGEIIGMRWILWGDTSEGRLTYSRRPSGSYSAVLVPTQAEELLDG